MLSAKVTIVKYAQLESAINFPDVRHDTTPASWEVMSPFVSLDTVCLGQKGGKFFSMCNSRENQDSSSFEKTHVTESALCFYGRVTVVWIYKICPTKKQKTRLPALYE